jgi:hypothetical protein
MAEWPGVVESLGVAVTALFTAATAFVVYKQSKEISHQTNQFKLQAQAMRLALQTQVARDLERDFYRDKTMISRRKAASAALLKNTDHPSVIDILNFFDSVGMLLRTGVIDDALAFHNFGRRALAYWSFAKSYVEGCRTTIPNVWNDFDSVLVEKMSSYMQARHYPINEEMFISILQNKTKLDA